MKIKSYQSGFTLIEMMMVVVIIAILAIIVIPSYQAYVQHALATQAQEQVQRLATELSRYKSRQFNYIGFELSDDLAVIPKGATGAKIKYSLSIVDGSDNSTLLKNTTSGQSWIIKALSDGQKNFSFVLSSAGVRCKTKVIANITGDTALNISCGDHANGAAEW